jgi:hypothetical protein
MITAAPPPPPPRLLLLLLLNSLEETGAVQNAARNSSTVDRLPVCALTQVLLQL